METHTHTRTRTRTQTHSLSFRSFLHLSSRFSQTLPCVIQTLPRPSAICNHFIPLLWASMSIFTPAPQSLIRLSRYIPIHFLCSPTGLLYCHVPLSPFVSIWRCWSFLCQFVELWLEFSLSNHFCVFFWVCVCLWVLSLVFLLTCWHQSGHPHIWSYPSPLEVALNMVC